MFSTIHNSPRIIRFSSRRPAMSRITRSATAALSAGVAATQIHRPRCPLSLSPAKHSSRSRVSCRPKISSRGYWRRRSNLMNFSRPSDYRIGQPVVAMRFRNSCAGLAISRSPVAHCFGMKTAADVSIPMSAFSALPGWRRSADRARLPRELPANREFCREICDFDILNADFAARRDCVALTPRLIPYSN
jgi:hypothetical protein